MPAGESMSFMPNDGNSESRMAQKGGESNSDDANRYPGDVDHVVSVNPVESSSGNAKTVTVFSNGTSIAAVSSDGDEDEDNTVKQTEFTHYDSNTGEIIEQRVVNE